MNDLIRTAAQSIISEKVTRVNQKILEGLSFVMLSKQTFVLRNRTQYKLDPRYYVVATKEIQFGEESLPEMTPYYTQEELEINCDTSTVVLVFRESVINNLLSQYYRIAEQSTLQHLMNVYFLKKMSYGFFSALLSKSRKEEYLKGQRIFKKGDTVDSFYVLLEGEIHIKVDMPERNTFTDYANGPIKDMVWANYGKRSPSKRLMMIIKTVSAGQCLGEVDLFQNSLTRDQYAECSSLTCEVLVVPAEALLKELRQSMMNPNLELGDLSSRNHKHVELVNQFSINIQKKSLFVLNSKTPQAQEKKMMKIARSASQSDMKNTMYVHPSFSKGVGSKVGMSIQDYMDKVLTKAKQVNSTNKTRRGSSVHSLSKHYC